MSFAHPRGIVAIAHERVAATGLPAHTLSGNFFSTRTFVDALPTVLLELPVSVVERADLAGLQPSRDAVEVECVLE